MPTPMFKVGRVGHVEPARLGDSLNGIKRTYNKGLRAQDINVHVTADGHVVPGHYDKLSANGFRTTGTIGGHTLTELEGFGIQPVTAWFEWAAAHNFALMLEWKPDRHTTDDAAKQAWARVKAEADRTGAKVAVMSIQAWAPRLKRGRAAALDNWERGSKARLRTVRDAGLPTVLLWRRAVSSDWWDIVSAVKSAPRAIRFPAGITRIGAGGRVPKARKPRRPIRFPWRPRSRRWRRQHPALWRRIVRWRRSHPRRKR